MITMNKRKVFLSVIIVILFLSTGFILYQNFHHKEILQNNIKYVKIAGVNVQVDLALTAEEQRQGLSGRSGLDGDKGMLFVFDSPDKYFFWMKDMKFPIDMIWISEDFRVVYIKKDARPELFPENYGPKENAKYVLEVVSGFSDKNSLKIGDKLQPF